MAGKWVDESFGFLAGWNFFIYEAILIPFELTALTLVLSFWRDDIPVAAVVTVGIVLYLSVCSNKLRASMKASLTTPQLDQCLRS